MRSMFFIVVCLLLLLLLLLHETIFYSSSCEGILLSYCSSFSSGCCFWWNCHCSCSRNAFHVLHCCFFALAFVALIEWHNLALVRKASFLVIVPPFFPVVVCDGTANALVNDVADLLSLNEAAAGRQPLKKESGRWWGSEFSLQTITTYCKYQCSLHLGARKPGWKANFWCWCCDAVNKTLQIPIFWMRRLTKPAQAPKKTKCNHHQTCTSTKTKKKNNVYASWLVAGVWFFVFLVPVQVWCI